MEEKEIPGAMVRRERGGGQSQRQGGQEEEMELLKFMPLMNFQ